MISDRFVYADHAATTPVTSHVREAMAPYLLGQYGNASALYRKGREARKALENARRSAAAALGAAPEELFFTACGTESDNWAIKGVAAAHPQKRHIVTDAVEHHAVLRACESLARFGWDVTVLPVDGEGFVDPDDVRRAIRGDTALVSVMAANNEVGTVEPVREIGAVCREAGVPFHTDAVQAAGHLPIDLHSLPVDLLSLSGHKFGAPKGVGVLYVRSGAAILPLLDGGGQERGLRAGTENVAGAVGLSIALTDACAALEESLPRTAARRDRLIEALCAIDGVRLNGSRAQRLCGNVNVSIAGVSGSRLLAALERAGVAASAGSACSAGSAAPSHVLAAMGVPLDLAACTLRLSIGPETTDADIGYLVETVPRVIARLRQ